MNAATRAAVRERAGDHCEFCGLAQRQEMFFNFHVEHVIPRQHGGGDEMANLALACYHCNLHKGTNLTAIDPQASAIVPLFHPRRQTWKEHFRRNGPLIEGKSPTGRATVRLLAMNAPDRRRLRED
jgi:hypothetical protein